MPSTQLVAEPRLEPLAARVAQPCPLAGLAAARGYRSEPGFSGGEVRLSRCELIRHLSAIAGAGDFVMVFVGFLLAFWIRFDSGLIPAAAGAHLPASLFSYWKLLVLGTVILFFGLVSKEMYRPGDLLHPEQIRERLLSVLFVGLFSLLGFSLIAKTTPSISRTFVLCAFGYVLLTVYGWRALLSRILQHPALARRLRQRLVCVGWTPEACRIHRSLLEDSRASVDFIGYIRTEKVSEVASSCGSYALGDLDELAAILEREAVDVLALVDECMPHGEVMRVVNLCEREQVEFKMVPPFFEVLVSGLRPGMIGALPVLALEGLPLDRYMNLLVKRAVDVLGAVVGLVLSLPLVIIFGALVRWESPGPIFYRQVRMGLHGALFHMIKLRSMRPDAEERNGPQWAQENDPRRLRIGAFMRKWNIDEVPQFWNVLKGDMSLVGPRPERPELIKGFKCQVPHYNSRHISRPGLTGWAQVNGWRGNTSLEERIRHDIWYLENWTLWLDLRIMVMTLLGHKNAY